ncbi:MAG: hydroxyisourate hydrolase [Bacteroidetes bacterium]|uniref:5-hydroxyisourate hydrolase n=1 Tax=Candidatus Caccoplasma merdipullorum TaxID=2840718 RepID=A0A9D9H8B1_9BACT|nr:hydroxyisourate hydrolase [Candidatus Caccoplasma merdipullorum]
MKKDFIFLLLFIFFSLTGIAQNRNYQLSSHILDIHTGKPASGVNIILSKQDTSGQWSIVEERMTDVNGRVKDFLEETPDGHRGIYKLTYMVGPYFELQGQDSFYPFIEVVFQIKDNAHYHVPITLSPYGYSTYRGN